MDFYLELSNAIKVLHLTFTKKFSTTYLFPVFKTRFEDNTEDLSKTMAS